jgi:hypothetical protein
VVYCDDVSILGGIAYIVKKNTLCFVFSNKENGLGINSGKIKYIVMSRNQNEG